MVVKKNIMTKFPNVIIKDSEYVKSAYQFKIVMSRMEQILKKYNEIIKYVCSNCIISGEIHNSLEEYEKFTNELIIVINGLGEKYSYIIYGFLSDIAKAGSYLYDKEVGNETRIFTDKEFAKLVAAIPSDFSEITDSLLDNITGFLLKAPLIGKHLKKIDRLLLDYNDETLQGLICLFEEVAAIDKKYGKMIQADGNTGHVCCIYKSLFSLKIMIKKMVAILKEDSYTFPYKKNEKELNDLYNKTQDFYEIVQHITFDETAVTNKDVEDFANSPYSLYYFNDYISIETKFISDTGISDTIAMILFNMFDVAEQSVKNILISTGLFYADGTLDYESYQEYITKKQILDNLDYLMNHTYDEAAFLNEQGKNFSNFKKWAKAYYDYYNTTRTKSGKLVIDGRTKEARRFREFIDNMGDVADIFSKGEKCVDYLSRLFAQYNQGIEMIESLKANTTDEKMRHYYDEILELYKKEYGAWTKEMMRTAADLGYDYVAGKVIETFPVCKVVSLIDKGIDLVGLLTGLAPKSKGQLNAMTYSQIFGSSNHALDIAIKKLREADPADPNYQTLVNDVKNCFLVNKRNAISLFNEMADASSENEKAYYKYCSKQIEKMKITDNKPLSVLSYDEFLALEV